MAWGFVDAMVPRRSRLQSRRTSRNPRARRAVERNRATRVRPAVLAGSRVPYAADCPASRRPPAPEGMRRRPPCRPNWPTLTGPWAHSCSRQARPNLYRCNIICSPLAGPSALRVSVPRAQGPPHAVPEPPCDLRLRKRAGQRGAQRHPPAGAAR